MERAWWCEKCNFGAHVFGEKPTPEWFAKHAKLCDGEPKDLGEWAAFEYAVGRVEMFH